MSIKVIRKQVISSKKEQDSLLTFDDKYVIIKEQVVSVVIGDCCMLKDVLDSDVEKIYVTKSERMCGSSSSLGNQIKWKHGNKFIKLNCLGYEDIAEVLVSRLLHYTDLNKNEYVDYFSCQIIEDGVLLGNGCYSYDFLNEGIEVTVSSILDDNLLPYSISYDDLREELYDIVGFDVKSYFDKILSIDSIIRNEDRHFKNISFILRDEKYIPSPIFDNGDSCMSDLISHPMSVPFDVNICSCYAKPFKQNYKDNFSSNVPLRIDVGSFFREVNVSEDRSLRALKTIEYGLRDMEGISWIRC